MHTKLSAILSVLALTLPFGASASGHSGPRVTTPSHVGLAGHYARSGVVLHGAPVPELSRNPYAGMDFDFRLELAAAHPGQPTVNVSLQRVLENVDGSWGALSVTGEGVNVSWNGFGSWPSAWDGELYDGKMDGLSVMFAEDATAMRAGDTFPVTIPSEYRDFDLTLSLDPDYGHPVVATVFLNVSVLNDSELDVSVDHVEYREVDADGRAWPLGTLE
jgi:hypothetical protein